jgi:hypothetical protein
METQALIFVAALLALAIAVLTALYEIVPNAPSKPRRQSYSRHRLWNIK